MTDVKLKVLIVEDDELILQMYQASLAAANFDVQIAKDGETGFKLAESFAPNVIILDFMLPKLSGLEVIQKIRASEKLKATPIIMMTSLNNEADQKRAMDNGATAYWVKNEVNMVDFPAKIKQVLGYAL